MLWSKSIMVGQAVEVLSRDSVVRFSDEELDIAQLLKAYGLPWKPACGHYVLDQSQLINRTSPFQDRVFFILDMSHFLRLAGSEERMVEGLCWLPTWEQAREILRNEQVDDRVVEQRLKESGAIVSGTERLELYRLIEESITGVLG